MIDTHLVEAAKSHRLAPCEKYTPYYSRAKNRASAWRWLCVMGIAAAALAVLHTTMPLEFNHAFSFVIHNKIVLGVALTTMAIGGWFILKKTLRSLDYLAFQLEKNFEMPDFKLQTNRVWKIASIVIPVLLGIGISLALPMLQNAVHIIAQKPWLLALTTTGAVVLASPLVKGILHLYDLIWFEGKITKAIHKRMPECLKTKFTEYQRLLAAPETPPIPIPSDPDEL